MKIDLLSLTVAILYIANAHSSPFPNWMDGVQDLNMKRLLELQEEGPNSTAPPPRLRCFICEKDCANEEELETCESGFSCSTVTAHKTENETITEMKIKVCLPPDLCSPELVCSNLNKTGDLESCNVECCNIDECNAEPTSPPTFVPLTAPPTTQPPTTPAPQIIPLRGNSGRFRSPGFSSGSYPPNLDITWTVSRRTMRGLLLNFLTIDTERGKDFITIRRGNSVVRTFSGVYRSRGKRSLSIPLYPEDGPCGDDDEVDDDDNYFGYDTPYDRLADAYDRYRRRRRRPRTPCVYVRGNQISINFSSDGNDTGQRGFEARFRVLRGGDDK